MFNSIVIIYYYCHEIFHQKPTAEKSEKPLLHVHIYIYGDTRIIDTITVIKKIFKRNVSKKQYTR